MRIHRWIAASMIAAPLAIIGTPSAQADVLGCNEQDGNRPANEESAAPGFGEDNNEAPFLALSDSVDIITINPKAAIAIEDEGHSETEGGGTSATTGESGAARPDEEEDDVEESCLLRSHDLLDVITINPEVSISLDDDPLLFEKNDEDENAHPTPQR
jgi:hypothetical protein